MNFDQLNEHSLKIFKRGCIKHVFKRVKESVQKHASDIQEAQICLHLVEKWLKNEASVSSEELRAVANAAWSAADSAWSAAGSADADAWSAVADAAWSADAVAYAAADAAAHAAAWSASADAAADADAVWQKANGVEKEWQQRFFNILLRQQQKMKQMRENKIQFQRELCVFQEFNDVVLYFRLHADISGLRHAIYKFNSEGILTTYVKSHRRG